NPRLAAQFSIPYTAAVALRRGRLALGDFSPAHVHAMSRELGSFIGAISVTHGEVVDDLLTPVRVTFENGATTLDERTIVALRGDAAVPLSAEQQREKLRVAAEGVLPEASLRVAEHAARAAGAEGPE